ncbi:MAG: DUF2508 family protein [Firmicutes bacterium]|nr:DUF2508 family protein [Bacillota bacterium]
MSSSITERLLLLTRGFFAEGETSTLNHDEEFKELEDAVELAKQEWLAAQSYFDYATDPELVDHAILSIQVAERKYMYWLKQAKKYGLEKRTPQ